MSNSITHATVDLFCPIDFHLKILTIKLTITMPWQNIIPSKYDQKTDAFHEMTRAHFKLF